VLLQKQLDFDKKMHNYMLKKKKKAFMEHSTAANSPPKAHAQKPNGGGYAAVQTFHEIKGKSPVK
jgi:hypothetical protein